MKSSINIKYDMDNEQLLSDYYATSSHTEIIRGLLSGMINEKTNNAHIAYGPYGSGKSYVSVILANIASKKISKKISDNLSERFKNVDNNVDEIVKKFNMKSRKYIVAKVNGYEGDFENVLLDAVFSALNDNELSYLIPGSVNTIKEIIKRWEENFYETYFNLTIEVGQEYSSFEEFLDKIDKGDDGAILFFSKTYETLTAGAKLELNNNQNLIKCFENICKALDKKGLGLLVIYDEFGRCLQNISDSRISVFMQSLQDLAELANNALQNLSMLFIAHKPVSYYFQNYSLEVRSEFAKIEKRYSVYEIKSDYTTFINILNTLIKSYKLDKIDKQTQKIQTSYVKKYRFFSSIMSDLEVEKLIIKNAYSLHPLAVYLLPKISSVFGQNERTLFTFLQDDSSIGFKGYMDEGTRYYYPDTLVDYFFINIDQTYVENYKVYSLFITYISSLNNVKGKVLRDNSTRLLKFAFLWTICKGNDIAKLDENLFVYALDINKENVIESIKELVSRKILRYNTISNFWEICEAINIDLEEEIGKIKSQYIASDHDLISLLNQCNPYNVIYPKNYNDAYEMTRFATITFESETANLEVDSDIRFHINIDGKHDIDSTSNDIQGNLNIDFDSFRKILIRLFSLNQMKTMSLYNSDKAIMNEVEFEIKKIMQNLDNVYEAIFSKECVFRINNDIISFSSFNALEKYLDDYFLEIYHQSFVIVNDQINMFQITKVQQKAVALVLDLILQHHSTDLEVYFKGAKPDYLIWYSMQRSNFQLLNETIKNHLEKNNTGSINSMMEIVQSPPFGARPAVSLLMIFFLLADYLSDIMFYVNGNYISNLTGQDIYDAVLVNKIELTYNYSHFDYQNREFLNSLLTVFPFESEYVLHKSLVVKLCSALNNWYLGLPVVVQQKAIPAMDIQQTTLLRIIEAAKTDPYSSIMRLQKDFSMQDILITKQSIEQIFDSFLRGIIQTILEKNKIKDTKLFLRDMSETQKKENKFISILSNDGNLILEYASIVEELDIRRWPISTFHMLERTIQNDIDNINMNIESDEIVIKGRRKAIIKTDLSIKGTTVKENIENMLKATQKFLTKREIEYIVYELLDEFVE